MTYCWGVCAAPTCRDGGVLRHYLAPRTSLTERFLSTGCPRRGPDFPAVGRLPGGGTVALRHDETSPVLLRRWSGGSVVGCQVPVQWGHSGTLTSAQRVGGGMPESRMPGISSHREGAWWGAATARRVQSLSRRRHRGGSHAVTRARALAVSDPVHPASPACSRQRMLPSRRP
jgi:hypothetical protein